MSDAVSSPSTQCAGWRLEHSYAELPAVFFSQVEPTPVSAPQLVIFNRALAAQLGLSDELGGRVGSEIFSGNRLPPGSRPLAQAYAGHQYGGFTILGDGRAILLGEQITPQRERFDIQLKGSGPTPYSRRGDGRAALGPMLREYVISEAMHALGIPTTRSLAVTATGEKIHRQTARPGAVLTRVAASHIRVGTFEWAAARQDAAALQALVDYSLRRHFPERVGTGESPAHALIEGVVERQASLIARWMLVGFVHGVMNTDNMAISGETIDYGPCAFMESYDPATVFSSIDARGRYAYGNQPGIAQWNLTRFIEALLPVLDLDEARAQDFATEVLSRFAQKYREHWLAGMRRKLGLFDDEPGDAALIDSLLGWMQTTKADFTNTFAGLSVTLPAQDGRGDDPVFADWHARWRARLGRQSQSPEAAEALRRAHCPAFIPRNHRVESALAAAEAGDLGPLHALLEVLAAPYDHTREAPDFREPAPVSEARYQTFCGT